MKIVTDSRTADAYIAGEDMGRFSDEWYFRASSVARDLGRNIFTQPPEDDASREAVRILRDGMSRAIDTFEPLNRPIWDALFPGWQSAEPHIDLIVGMSDPYEAVTEYDEEGRVHIIFDLLLWNKYSGIDIASVIRNLLTHEITHLLIGSSRAVSMTRCKTAAMPNVWTRTLFTRALLTCCHTDQRRSPRSTGTMSVSRGHIPRERSECARHWPKRTRKNRINICSMPSAAVIMKNSRVCAA